MDLKSKGFTLLEVVAASIILSVGLIPIMKILPGALGVSEKIEIITKCTFFAEQRMEWAKAKLLASYQNPSNWGGEQEGQCMPGASPPDDKYKYEITDVDPGWLNLNEIKVIVWFDKDGYDDIDGDENQVILVTKVASR